MPTAPGTVVVLSRTVPLAVLVCFKCGNSKDVALLPCDFRTTPKDVPALDAAQAAGLFVGVIGSVAGLVASAHEVYESRQATVGIPLCPKCAANWAKAARTRRFALVPFYLALLACLLTLVVLAAAGSFAGSLKYVFAGVAGVVLWILRDIVPKRVEARAHAITCGAVAIDAGTIALSRVHPRASAAVESAST